MQDLGSKDLVTFGTALLGAALGIINTWASINQRRVRLRVRPAHTLMIPREARAVCVEVVNLTTFAVTVDEVGFVPFGGRGRLPERIFAPRPVVLDDKPWPRRLEQREAVTVYFDYDELRGRGRMMAWAYARTACGEMAYGRSPALRQLRRESA